MAFSTALTTKRNSSVGCLTLSTVFPLLVGSRSSLSRLAAKRRTKASSICSSASRQTPINSWRFGIVVCVHVCIHVHIVVIVSVCFCMLTSSRIKLACGCTAGLGYMYVLCVYSTGWPHVITHMSLVYKYYVVNNHRITISWASVALLCGSVHEITTDHKQSICMREFSSPV